MELLILPDHEALSRAAADAIQGALMEAPEAAVAPATGNTPLRAYQLLAERQRAGQFDARRLRVFQLDEYLPLGPDDPRSLAGWTVRAFLDPLEIPHGQLTRLRGEAADPLAACREWDEALAAAGGLTLAVLGLGPNGHLAFNEPPSDDQAPTRPVALAEASLESNAAYWGGRQHVPARAITAGMRHLLSARRVLLLASGAGKHHILRAALEGPVTPEVPASYLQRCPRAAILADEAAWHGA